MDTSNTPMTTITEVLEHLRKRNQDIEFQYENGAFHAGKGKEYQPEDLKIIKTYRFEGDSNPADMSIIYLIEANDGLIGYSIDVYGADSDQAEGYDDFIRQIEIVREGD
jgi:hypothetical protein